MDYRCTHGHDLCHVTYPGPDCPYCERETMYSSACMDFAELALADHPELRDRARELAQLIQDTVDDFIDMASNSNDE